MDANETNHDTHDEAVATAPAKTAPVNAEINLAKGAGDGELYGYLAEYDTPGELIAAAEKVRDAGFTKWDCYSPFPVHGIDPAMGIKRTILPLVVFSMGITGLGLGLLLQWWTNAHNWPWIVSGKPFWSLPANIPIAFEVTILLSVFASFFGMWGLNKLPQWWHPFFRTPRFARVTDDGFFLGIEAADDKFDADKTVKLLTDAGAIAIDACHYDADPEKKKMPKAIFAFIVISGFAALIPFALIAKARNTHSNKPHVHIFAGMDFQPKAKAQRAFDFFPDGRAMRGNVEGTVARGALHADEHLDRGLVGDAWATTFPGNLTVDEATMARGKQKFEVYCSPCHGVDGKGLGMVTLRARKVPTDGASWAPPADLTGVAVVTQPHGQLFNTISNGKNTMAGYAEQIEPVDRWKIILYVRALQRGQNPTPADTAGSAQ